MKTFVLFLSSMFLLLSCSTKPDQKELNFYNRLLEQEIAEVKQTYSRMKFHLNTQNIKRDTSSVLKVSGLIDTADLYVNQNRLHEIQQIMVSEFRAIKADTSTDKEIKKYIHEITSLDSLYNVRRDTLSNLVYRIGIYSNLKYLIQLQSQNMGYSCFPGMPTSVQYESKGYVLNDTFLAIVSPCVTTNKYDYVSKFNFDQLEVEYLPFDPKRKNFTLVNIATKDTVPIAIRRLKTNLLITTVFKEKGDYLLNGQSYIKGEPNRFGFYSTNTIIQIR
jgi:hypothetical protein